MPRNIFVIALDDFNAESLQSLPEFRRYRFHSLLPQGDVLKADSYDYDQLLMDANEQLRGFDDTVDGIVTWWDFPSSGLVPVLAEHWDLYGPSLRSVVLLEHKYWSRIAQRAVTGEHVPAFAAFDPLDDQALDRVREGGVDFPFWLKPVKSVGSYLGFRIEGPEDFAPAIATMREEIGQFGDPFDQALARVDLPPDIVAVGGSACLAEGIIGGWQCTLEGYVSHGETHVYGTVDSLRVPGMSTFRCYQYPSRLPIPIQRRMEQIAKAVVAHAQLDHCCFNAEFFYDEAEGQIWILEVNTRLSQSHFDLFAKVDGVSSQRVMLSVSQGRVPRMPFRQGDFNVAGKYFLRTTEDGRVRSVPSEQDLTAVRERFPGTRVEIDPVPGMTLSELAVQETYSFELGRAFIGADDHDQLEQRFEAIEAMLPFEIEAITA
ncbi:MAG: ATP-grasp domain-containing protein [Nitriliruptoraceae bacterium]